MFDFPKEMYFDEKALGNKSVRDESVVYVWADQTGGWRSLCIKIGYSEPTRAESRERTSTQAESSRVK